jgi:hypothetical protein
MDKHTLDNRSNQLNPKHDAYYQSRGLEGRPKDQTIPGQKKDDAAPEPAKQVNQRKD